MLSDSPNILLVRMRVYLVGPVKTRTVNYLYVKKLSDFFKTTPSGKMRKDVALKTLKN